MVVVLGVVGVIVEMIRVEMVVLGWRWGGGGGRGGGGGGRGGGVRVVVLGLVRIVLERIKEWCTYYD